MADLAEREYSLGSITKHCVRNDFRSGPRTCGGKHFIEKGDHALRTEKQWGEEKISIKLCHMKKKLNGLIET